MVDSNSHVIAKCVSTFLLFGATVLFGLLPIRLISKKNEPTQPGYTEEEHHNTQASTRRKKLFVSFCNCFAGGVFFSTCILDLLPMVRNRMEEAINNVGFQSHFPLGEFIASVGFLLMLVTEQIVHICSHGSILSHDMHHEQSSDEDENIKEPLLFKADENGPCCSYGAQNTFVVDSKGLQTSECSCDQIEILPSPQQAPVAFSKGPFEDSDCHHDIVTPFVRRRSRSLVSVQTIAQTNFRTYILVFALSLHSIFEGLSLGLVTGMDTLMQLIVAMSIHKCILAFSLGVQLVEAQLKASVIIKGIILFAAMAPIGMGLGLAVLSSFSRTINLFFSGVLQGIATGTFLYVTFFEVLPHELNLTGPSRQLLLKSLFVVLGFSVITGICYYENKFYHIKKILPGKG